MKRRFQILVTAFALGAIAVALASPTIALGKGKSDRSNFAQSLGNNNSGGSNAGGSSNPMKFHASRTKSFSTGNNNGSGNGNSNTSMFNQSLSKKSRSSLSTNSFNQFQQNGSNFQKLYTKNSNGNTGIAGQLDGQFENKLGDAGVSKNRRRPPHWGVPQLNQQNLADAVQTGKFKPIDLNTGNGGIGNGTGGNGGTIKWPGKFTSTDNGIRIGEPHGPGAGDDHGKGPGKGKNKKCHDNDFPWWPIIVGGCYTGGGCYHGNNCHHHHGCYDNYNGGYYGSYSNVTNIVIQEPTAPVEPALAQGIDLELLNVELVDAGDAARNLGPRYRLTFGNRGTLPAGNFQVMLMASTDGTPKAGLPMATSEIVTLASRQVVTADVRLPLSADLSTLTKFIVVIDSVAQIAEPDENNNLAILDRDKIVVIVQ